MPTAAQRAVTRRITSLLLSKIPALAAREAMVQGIAHRRAKALAILPSLSARSRHGGLHSVISLLQSNPKHEDQSADNANQYSWILCPFHFFGRLADFREIPSRLAVLRTDLGFFPVLFTMVSRSIVFASVIISRSEANERPVRFGAAAIGVALRIGLTVGITVTVHSIDA